MDLFDTNTMTCIFISFGFHRHQKSIPFYKKDLANPRVLLLSYLQQYSSLLILW